MARGFAAEHQRGVEVSFSCPLVLNLVQSYVTLRVPLHVSYVFHSPVGAGGWQHFDLQSELRLTFVYDTAIFLVRTEPTYNQPIQQWTFVSDFAVRDYSGSYTVKLLPCASSPNLEYSIPPTCNPRDPRTLWLSDGSMGFGQESDAAFSPGDVIYGRVMVDPVQNLGDSFVCSIEKIFLCTGADGYVPKYNPDNFEFGCLADAPSLLYRFKVIDKAQPETQAHSFGGLAFEAYLAVDDATALPLVRQPGSDGFRMDSSALFQVAAGREWFIHTIYTVRSRENANRGIGKRSVEYHAVSRHGDGQRRSRRSAAASRLPDLAEEIGVDRDRGTNILHVALNRDEGARGPAPEEEELLPGGGAVTGGGVAPRELSRPGEEGDEWPVLVVGAFVGLLLTALVAVVIALLLRSRKDKTETPGPRPPATSASTEPMVAGGGGDSSEV
ncbi:hypothetical protein CRUP_011252 [Coryphaenoides rupestris]|nr:hypothetical protein CRUP_011252 [Coryphaenoides rupestris]